jgi:hypothetical protein
MTFGLPLEVFLLIVGGAGRYAGVQSRLYEIHATSDGILRDPIISQRLSRYMTEYWHTQIPVKCRVALAYPKERVNSE